MEGNPPLNQLVWLNICAVSHASKVSCPFYSLLLLCWAALQCKTTGCFACESGPNWNEDINNHEINSTSKTKHPNRLLSCKMVDNFIFDIDVQICISNFMWQIDYGLNLIHMKPNKKKWKYAMWCHSMASHIRFLYSVLLICIRFEKEPQSQYFFIKWLSVSIYRHPMVYTLCDRVCECLSCEPNSMHSFIKILPLKCVCCASFLRNMIRLCKCLAWMINWLLHFKCLYEYKLRWSFYVKFIADNNKNWIKWFENFIELFEFYLIGSEGTGCLGKIS